MKITILVFTLILSNLTTLLPFDGLLFKPYAANTFEPRTGAMLESRDKKVRLDIGASFDLISYKPDNTCALRLGSDFFTYTRLRSEGNFKFPVETADFYFGFNISYAKNNLNNTFSSRLRIAHISSHLVDGLSVDTIFTKAPFVYSREFADWSVAYSYGNLRPYLGLDYVFSTKPKDPDQLIPQIGFDYYHDLDSLFRFIGGYDFKLLGISGVYTGENTIQAGIELKTADKRGIFIYTSYFSGRSIHGMFYNVRDNYISVGFQVIFY